MTNSTSGAGRKDDLDNYRPTPQQRQDKSTKPSSGLGHDIKFGKGSESRPDSEHLRDTEEDIFYDTVEVPLKNPAAQTSTTQLREHTTIPLKPDNDVNDAQTRNFKRTAAKITPDKIYDEGLGPLKRGEKRFHSSNVHPEDSDSGSDAGSEKSNSSRSKGTSQSTDTSSRQPVVQTKGTALGIAVANGVTVGAKNEKMTSEMLIGVMHNVAAQLKDYHGNGEVHGNVASSSIKVLGSTEPGGNKVIGRLSSSKVPQAFGYKPIPQGEPQNQSLDAPSNRGYTLPIRDCYQFAMGLVHYVDPGFESVKNDTNQLLDPKDLEKVKQGAFTRVLNQQLQASGYRPGGEMDTGLAELKKVIKTDPSESGKMQKLMNLVSSKTKIEDITNEIDNIIKNNVGMVPQAKIFLSELKKAFLNVDFAYNMAHQVVRDSAVLDLYLAKTIDKEYDKNASADLKNFKPDSSIFQEIKSITKKTGTVAITEGFVPSNNETVVVSDGELNRITCKVHYIIDPDKIIINKKEISYDPNNKQFVYTGGIKVEPGCVNVVCDKIPIDDSAKTDLKDHVRKTAIVAINKAFYEKLEEAIASHPQSAINQANNIRNEAVMKLGNEINQEKKLQGVDEKILTARMMEEKLGKHQEKLSKIK